MIIFLESVFRHKIAAKKHIQNFMSFDVSCEVFALLLILKRGKNWEVLMLEELTIQDFQTSKSDTSYSTSPNLSFLIYKIGIMISLN